MATADTISNDAMKSVASQLAAFAPPLPVGAAVAAAGAAREVAESFAVCFVPAATVTNPPKDLGAVLRPTGTWHHQIREGGQPSGFATSAQGGFGGDDFSVHGSFESPLAAKIDDAIGWVDQNVQGQATVRLMTIPAYFVHAFGIERAGVADPAQKYTAVLIDQPQTFTKLSLQKEYPLSEFLKLLAQEKQSPSLG